MRCRRTRFDELKEHCRWWAAYGKNSTCCQKATDEEIAENPEAFDCDGCDLMRQLTKLSPENAEAWQVFQYMCGRTVRDCQLEGWMLERYTAGWELEDTLTLVKRLDIIASVLSPTHGPTENRRHR